MPSAAAYCFNKQERIAAHSRKQFVREMRILNGLRHPCVAQIVGAVLASGMEPMMIMVVYCVTCDHQSQGIFASM
jgi:enoyl-CoA hydratase/carnithine racemase